MGYYLNPTTKGFQDSLNSEIYVDKTGLIEQLNRLINTEQRYVCVSRPRRFGKSMAIKMLSAYYNAESDADELFKDFKIGKTKSYKKHLNQYDVIRINMTDFIGRTNSSEELLKQLEIRVIEEFKEKYPDIVHAGNEGSLAWVMQDVYRRKERYFVILVDEWDCIFREYKDKKEEQGKYLDFLRN